MEHELQTLPEHLSSPPVFRRVLVSRLLVLCVLFCRSVFVLFLLSIVFSVLLRFSDSDYPLVSSNFSYVMGPHNRWYHHQGKQIVVDSHYYNTAYNTTYIVATCGVFSNAFSLTSDIGLLFMVLKCSFTFYSGIIIDIPALSKTQHM